MLKTCPTKAGPPPRPAEIRTVEGNPEPAFEEGELSITGDEEKEVSLDSAEESESGWAESDWEASELGESGRRKGRWILEERGGRYAGLGLRKEDRLVAAVCRKRGRWVAGLRRRQKNLKFFELRIELEYI